MFGFSLLLVTIAIANSGLGTCGPIICSGTEIERRHPMQPGQWAMENKLDDAMLAAVPAMIDRIQPVMGSAASRNCYHLNLISCGISMRPTLFGTWNLILESWYRRSPSWSVSSWWRYKANAPRTSAVSMLNRNVWQFNRPEG